MSEWDPVIAASLGSSNAKGKFLRRRRARPEQGKRRNQEAYDRFRKVAGTIRAVATVSLVFKSYFKKFVATEWSLHEMALNLQHEIDEVLGIPPVDETQESSDRLVRLLSLHPSERSDDHIDKVRALIRENKAFSNYPKDTQTELGKCLIYQKYEPRRIIYKETFPPDAYYVILTGNVLVNVYDENPETGARFKRTRAELKAGDSFGHHEIIEDVPRKSTVICKTTVELLMILRDDYEQIIKDPFFEKRNECLDYCRSMELFAHFPCHTLDDPSAQFRFEFFKKGKVIIQDVSDSDYIVVIKSGRARLVRRLQQECQVRQVRPRSVHGLMFSSRFPTEELRKDLATILRPHTAAPAVFHDRRPVSQLSRPRSQVVGPRYVQIAEYGVGNVMGLELFLNRKVESMTLISDECECIFVNRRHFQKYADSNIKSICENMASTFPTGFEISAQLHEEKKWQDFKKATIRQAVLNSGRRQLWS